MLSLVLPSTIPDQVLGPDRLGSACLGPDRSVPKGTLSVVRERLTDLLLHSQPVPSLSGLGEGRGVLGTLAPCCYGGWALVLMVYSTMASRAQVKVWRCR